MTTWLLALTGPALVVVAAAGAIDLLRRGDLRWPGRVLWAVAAVAAPPIAALAYVMTRPVGGGRVLLGAPAGDASDSTPAGGPRQRLLRQVGRLAARGLFRSVEVVRPATLVESGPQLWIASHFGAFSDPIVLLHALDRPPRFLAADGLFRVPVLGAILRGAGAIPVRRSQDGGGRANASAFDAAWEALRGGHPVGIFPEGIANDTATIAALRTGAARIALGAQVPGLQVVPVGIHYEDKAGLRRHVFVDVGPPLHLDTWRADREDADERATVRALTAELERRLRAVSPAFTDLDEQHALLTAASVALRGAGGAAPSWGERAELADHLAERDEDDRRSLRHATDAYRSALAAAGLHDEDVLTPSRPTWWRIVAQLLVGVALLPPALLGTVLHAPLVALVWLTGRLRVAPVTAATIRPLTAVAAALLTWSLTAWWAASTDLAASAVAAVAIGFVVVPAWGVAALVVAERIDRMVGAARRHARRPAAGELATILATDRQRVVDLVVGQVAS